MILGPLSQAGLLGVRQLRPPDFCSYPAAIILLFQIVYCPFSRLLCLFGNDCVASYSLLAKPYRTEKLAWAGGRARAEKKGGCMGTLIINCSFVAERFLQKVES